MQPDGKIVVAGGHSGDFVVVRYLPNGALDTSFGVNGIKEINLPRNDEAYSIAVLKDGQLALAGYSNGDFALMFLNANGSVCGCGQTFSEPRILTDFGGDDIAYALAVQPDGKLVVAGGKRTTPSQIYLARYKFDNSAGTLPGYRLDASFGNQGKEVIAVGSHSVARGLAIDANNRMTIVGYGNNGSDDDFVVVRELNSVTLTTLAANKRFIYLPLIRR